MDTRKIALIATLSSTAVALRLLKHMVLGTVQFINIPLSIAMVSGILFGRAEGLLTGILSFIVSDTIIGLGPWTLVNSLLAGFFGSLWGSLKNHRMEDAPLFILAFLCTLTYDVTSSFILYLWFGLPPTTALLFSIVGLFLPVYGGWVIGIGPITEISTGILTVALKKGIESRIQLHIGS